MNHLSVDDLVRLASFGGGFELEAGHRSTDDLVRIVGHMKANASIEIRNSAYLPLDDLIRIASYAAGTVIFRA